MDMAINAAQWAVGKALAPLAGTVLEAWAASKSLGPNVDALKDELLYVQTILHGARGRERGNPALEELMQKLQDFGYDAEDVLDELDYFRVQDELDGTSDAADEHSLIHHAQQTAKATVGKLLNHQADGGQGYGRRHKPASCSCNPFRSIGKRLPCSSQPSVDADGHSGMLTMPGAMHSAPHRQRAQKTTKLEFDRVDISKRMKLIVEKIQPVRDYVLKILGPLGSSPSTGLDIARSRPITISESIEPKLYGRDDVINAIIHDITKGKYIDKNLTVLPIVGPGGIGKTTLTQHIYHSQEVKKHFHVKVWTCVSVNFNANKLLQEIQKHTPGVDGEKAGATTIELIGQRLEHKRFLLVLDDMWKCSNEDDWKTLLLPLKKSQEKGSIIIVTTRFLAIAKKVKTIDRPVELEGLERKEFEKLFLAYVFDDDEHSIKDHAFLLETGERIMDKLKGSPLAAKTVGKLLRNNLDLGHWIGVLESKEWGSRDEEHDIMPALKLSYDYLPFHLQQCFVYCALFPQDYKFNTKELIHFWIGLDILHPRGNKRKPEEIGGNYLDELISHGFLKKDNTYKYPCYLIHDLLHDLALKVATREFFVINRSNVRSAEIQPSMRHLSIIIDDTDESDGISNENFATELRKLKMRLKVHNLRFLMIFGKYDKRVADIFCDYIRDAIALRVLHLPVRSFSVESMPLDFSALVHLRYLRLRTNYGMHLATGQRELHLPKTISRFYHLRILDLEACDGSLVLPSDMSNLTKLRHFLTNRDKVHHSCISNVGMLQVLQELKHFNVKKESNGFELKELGNLIELNELGIYSCEKIQIKEEATEANLVDKKSLRKLTLAWDIARRSIEPHQEALILESLQPSRNLHDLCIEGHGGPSCPTWLGNKPYFQALKSLCLDGVAWKVLPPFEQMWVLQELKLKNISTIKELDTRHFGGITEQSFRNLKKLKLVSLIEFEKWVLGDTCHLFSRLEVLTIARCPRLLGLPLEGNSCHPATKDQGDKIDWFPNLQKFKIIHCKNVSSLPPIPWTPTLRSVKIGETGSMQLSELEYSKSSSYVRLKIKGRYYGLYCLNRRFEQCTLKEGVLDFNNLSDLQDLEMCDCPPIESKHLRMLTSLKSFSVCCTSHAFVASESEAKLEWQLPVERLLINKCGAGGEELTQLLNHFPNVSSLDIRGHEARGQMLTQIGVEGDLQQPITTVVSPSCSVVEMEDTSLTYKQLQKAKKMEEQEKNQGGLLLLPAHYCDSLRELYLRNCSELCLVAPLCIDSTKAGRQGAGGGGLRTLRCLRRLRVTDCPRFLSAFEISSFPSCFPFPSSLQLLHLEYAGPMRTMEPLSNLMSLIELRLDGFGRDLRGEGIWPLLSQGHLRELKVCGSPKFFIGLDRMRGRRDGDQEQLSLCRSSKLQELWTDDITGFFSTRICTIHSSSLTRLMLVGNMGCFTKDQEEALQLLTSLQELDFNELRCLPAGLCKLPKLKRIVIHGCPSIRSLPKDGLPDSLQELNVQYCFNEELKQQCRNFILDHPGITLRV